MSIRQGIYSPNDLLVQSNIDLFLHERVPYQPRR